MILSQLDDKELEPGTASRAGAYQTEALLEWSEYHHCQFRHRIAKQHLGQYLLSVIRWFQLQAGSMVQDEDSFVVKHSEGV